jgi:hypothetical protein
VRRNWPSILMSRRLNVWEVTSGISYKETARAGSQWMHGEISTVVLGEDSVNSYKTPWSESESEIYRSRDRRLSAK